MPAEVDAFEKNWVGDRSRATIMRELAHLWHAAGWSACEVAAQQVAEADRAAQARCHADRDGDCSWFGCPQLRDGEPAATGRHCPLDVRDPEE